MITKEELLQEIISLRNRLDALEGKQRGPITLREYIIAGQRGDKVTMRMYLDQFKKSAGPALCVKREVGSAGTAV